MLSTVLDYLDLSAEKYPNKVAFVEGERRITYDEFRKEVIQVAGWILSHVKCQHSPIVVRMKNTIDALLAFWAVAYTGNIYVPVDSEMPQERWEQMVELICPAMIIDTTNMAREGEIDFNAIKSADVNSVNILEYRKGLVDTDPLYILFTSGSTGIPKGVTISHASVIDFTEEASEVMKFSDKEIFLNQAPFYFDASVPDIYCTVRNGATLHLVDHKWFSFPIKLLDYMEKEKVNAIYWVPSALVTVANLKALGKRNLSCLKKVMFCGEVMPTKQYNMWKKELPEAKFVNYYGPCETTYASAYYVIDKEFKDDEPLPIGKAANNTKIILIDDNKEVLEPEKIGEIYIGGRGVSLGYYNDKERTNKAFVQNPVQNQYKEILYKTGDLAHFDKQRNIYFDGRSDYQIKHMGYRVELEEIEIVARGIKNIIQTACIYSEKKKTIVLYYAGSKEKNKILEELRKKLQFYMVPSVIIQLDVFPMNQNGKIDRLLLKKMYDEKEA